MIANVTTDHTKKTAENGEPLMFVDTRVPAVRSALAIQQGSTWPEIPCNAPTSWMGWKQCPGGLEYMPAITSSGPAQCARWGWDDLPNRHRDDFYLVGGATYNTIMLHSTFATPAAMRGFLRAVKATTGVRL